MLSALRAQLPSPPPSIPCPAPHPNHLQYFRCLIRDTCGAKEIKNPAVCKWEPAQTRSGALGKEQLWFAKPSRKLRRLFYKHAEGMCLCACTCAGVAPALGSPMGPLCSSQGGSGVCPRWSEGSRGREGFAVPWFSNPLCQRPLSSQERRKAIEGDVICSFELPGRQEGS